MLRLTICLGLVALAGLQVVKIATTVIEGNKSQLTGFDRQRAEQVPPSHHNYNAAGRIFGESKTGSVGEILAPDMTMELQGVLAADDPTQSIAIIRIDGKDMALLVGSVLPDGEKLKQIDSIGVTFARADKERRLDLQMTGTALLGGVAGQLQYPANSGVHLPAISPNVTKTASVASRLAELRAQALGERFQKAKSDKPSSDTARKPHGY